jgi:hypothetical protein
MKQIIKEALQEKVLAKFKEYLEKTFSGEMVIHDMGDYLKYRVINIGVEGSSDSSFFDVIVKMNFVITADSTVNFGEHQTVAEFIKNSSLNRDTLKDMLRFYIRPMVEEIGEYFSIDSISLQVHFTVE